MSFHFARLQSDGRLTSPLPKVYQTAKEAKEDAPYALRHVQARGGKIVLVEVLEEAALTFKVMFRDAANEKGSGKP